MYKKIGILGGTFDPFHKGHFQLAKASYEQFLLDEVWIMPNGNPPHKRETEQIDFELRCEMIRLAIQQVPYMHLCDIEGSEHCYHYTYQTLESFHKMYPEYEFYFIIGADSLKDFPTWKEPSRIAKLCTLLVANRDDSDRAELETWILRIKEMFQAQCMIINSPKVDVSSREIRAMLQQKKDVSAYVGQTVFSYIRRMGLYSSQEPGI